MKTGLQRVWEQAQVDLGIDLVIPFDLDLANGVIIPTELLVKNFGDTNGMVIVTDFSVLENHSDQLVKLGFGYSTLSEPREPGTYNRQAMIEMLSEWGWSGPVNQAPSWLITQDPR